MDGSQITNPKIKHDTTEMTSSYSTVPRHHTHMCTLAELNQLADHFHQTSEALKTDGPHVTHASLPGSAVASISGSDMKSEVDRIMHLITHLQKMTDNCDALVSRQVSQLRTRAFQLFEEYHHLKGGSVAAAAMSFGSPLASGRFSGGDTALQTSGGRASVSQSSPGGTLRQSSMPSCSATPNMAHTNASALLYSPLTLLPSPGPGGTSATAGRSPALGFTAAPAACDNSGVGMASGSCEGYTKGLVRRSHTSLQGIAACSDDVKRFLNQFTGWQEEKQRIGRQMTVSSAATSPTTLQSSLKHLHSGERAPNSATAAPTSAIGDELLGGHGGGGTAAAAGISYGTVNNDPAHTSSEEEDAWLHVQRGNDGGCNGQQSGGEGSSKMVESKSAPTEDEEDHEGVVRPALWQIIDQLLLKQLRFDGVALSSEDAMLLGEVQRKKADGVAVGNTDETEEGQQTQTGSACAASCPPAAAESDVARMLNKEAVLRCQVEIRRGVKCPSSTRSAQCGNCSVSVMKDPFEAEGEAQETENSHAALALVQQTFPLTSEWLLRCIREAHKRPSLPLRLGAPAAAPISSVDGTAAQRTREKEAVPARGQTESLIDAFEEYRELPATESVDSAEEIDRAHPEHSTDTYNDSHPWLHSSMEEDEGSEEDLQSALDDEEAEVSEDPMWSSSMYSASSAIAGGVGAAQVSEEGGEADEEENRGDELGEAQMEEEEEAEEEEEEGAVNEFFRRLRRRRSQSIAVESAEASNYSDAADDVQVAAREVAYNEEEEEEGVAEVYSDDHDDNDDEEEQAEPEIAQRDFRRRPRSLPTSPRLRQQRCWQYNKLYCQGREVRLCIARRARMLLSDLAILCSLQELSLMASRHSYGDSGHFTPQQHSQGQEDQRSHSATSSTLESSMALAECLREAAAFINDMHQDKLIKDRLQDEKKIVESSAGRASMLLQLQHVTAALGYAPLLFTGLQKREGEEKACADTAAKKSAQFAYCVAPFLLLWGNSSSSSSSNDGNCDVPAPHAGSVISLTSSHLYELLCPDSSEARCLSPALAPLVWLESVCTSLQDEVYKIAQLRDALFAMEEQHPETAGISLGEWWRRTMEGGDPAAALDTVAATAAENSLARFVYPLSTHMLQELDMLNQRGLLPVPKEKEEKSEEEEGEGCRSYSENAHEEGELVLSPRIGDLALPAALASLTDSAAAPVRSAASVPTPARQQQRDREGSRPLESSPGGGSFIQQPPRSAAVLDAPHASSILLQEDARLFYAAHGTATVLSTLRHRCSTRGSDVSKNTTTSAVVDSAVCNTETALADERMKQDTFFATGPSFGSAHQMGTRLWWRPAFRSTMCYCPVTRRRCLDPLISGAVLKSVSDYDADEEAAAAAALEKAKNVPTRAGEEGRGRSSRGEGAGQPSERRRDTLASWMSLIHMRAPGGAAEQQQQQERSSGSAALGNQYQMLQRYAAVAAAAADGEGRRRPATVRPAPPSSSNGYVSREDAASYIVGGPSTTDLDPRLAYVTPTTQLLTRNLYDTPASHGGDLNPPNLLNCGHVISYKALCDIVTTRQKGRGQVTSDASVSCPYCGVRTPVECILTLSYIY